MTQTGHHQEANNICKILGKCFRAFWNEFICSAAEALGCSYNIGANTQNDLCQWYD